MQAEVTKRDVVDADEIRLAHGDVQVSLAPHADESLRMDVAVRDMHALAVTLDMEGAVLLAEQGYSVHVAQGESAVLFAGSAPSVLLSLASTRGALKSAKDGMARAMADAMEQAGAQDGADTDVLHFVWDRDGEIRLQSVEPGARKLTKEEGAEIISALLLPEGTPEPLVDAHAALARAQAHLDKLAGANVDTKAHTMLVTAAQLLQDAESLAQTLAERREQDESQDAPF